MAGEVERLAFELAQRSLSQQEHALDELRSRSGTLVAASALATSFLAVRGAGADAGPFTRLALAAFLVSLLASAYVVFPRRALVFAVSASEAPADLPTEYRRLSTLIEMFHTANQAIFDRLLRAFAAATLSLVAEAIFLSIELLVR